MTERKPPPRPPAYDKKVGLVLQGGGALGSYQAGVYEALAASEYLPDWVAGISIGSVNAAIIAGNAPEHRIAPSARFLGGSDRTHAALAVGARRAAGGLAAEGKRLDGGDVRPAGILHPAYAAGLVVAAPTGELLRHRRAQGHARAAGRFRPHQRPAANTPERRGGERAHRRLRLFRQREADDPSRARDGERRAAARLPTGRDRRRVLLGRRALFQHAAAIRDRLFAAPQPADLPGRPVRGLRPGAAQSRRGRRARQGYPLFQPDADRHQTC